MDKSKPETPATVVLHSVLSAVSHELRGPLGVARGYLRLLAMGATLDDRSATAVRNAGRAADRMAELLDELSQYARWVRGESRLAVTGVRLLDVLTAAAAASQLPETPVVTVTAQAPAELEMQADRDQLSRAIGHLVSAVARAQAEDTTLFIRGAAVNGQVEVRIGTAEGLDRAGEEIDPMLERSGLGLAVAQADLLVRLHRGQLAERWSGRMWGGYVVRL